MKMNLTDFLIVFAGSGLGGVCRYGLSHAVALNTGGVIFPWGTFAVNMLGCLLIGVIYGLADRWSVLNPELRLLLTVGFCGGFTTFSSFINEDYMLFGASEFVTAAAYATVSLFAGFGCVWLGNMIVR